MFHPNKLKSKSSPTNISITAASASATTNSSHHYNRHHHHRAGRGEEEGAGLSFLLIVLSLLRLVKLPFRRLHHQMSSKSLLPSYQDDPRAGFGSARHHPNHHHHKSHHSPSRRKKTRCVPKLRHVVWFLVTVFFILYVTDCLHLYKRISLKKDNGRIHLQTTSYNFRLNRGPIDFSFGTFYRKDWVEINVPPEQ